jgi:hypothetical protein
MGIESYFANYFTYPLGLYALLSLLILILLYLIRPKPKKLSLPTLQFLLKKRGKKEKSSFLQKLIESLLFFIQFLILLFLALSIAEPFFNLDSKISSENSVIVLDVSGSMGADNLFKEAQDFAKSHVGRQTSIVIVQETPLIALERGGRLDAIEVINKLKPTISGSNIADALNSAVNLVGDSGDTEIVIISDFRQTSNGDLLVAKASAEAKGLGVKMIDISQDLDNIAIVDIVVERLSTKIYVKNYFDQQKIVKLDVAGTKHELTIPAGSLEILEIATPEGITKVEIQDKDALMLDNIAYIATPEDAKVNVLLISSNKGTFLQHALESFPLVELTVTEPPLIPGGDYDFVFFHEVDVSKLLPGSIKSISDQVNEGLNVVFTYNEKVPDMEIFPLIVDSFVEVQSPVSLKLVNTLTQGRDFGTVKKYYKASLKPGTVELASSQDGQPLLATREVGNGNVFYFGISEKDSDFKFSPHFPLFWDSLIVFFEEVESLSEYNKKGGDIVVFDSDLLIKKPSGMTSTSILLFDESGVYEYDDKQVVASMLNGKESDLKLEKSISESSSSTGQKSGETNSKVPYSYSWILLLIALIFILFEIYYVKKGGNL